MQEIIRGNCKRCKLFPVSAFDQPQPDHPIPHLPAARKGMVPFRHEDLVLGPSMRDGKRRVK
jgi:hypothetical protein